MGETKRKAVWNKFDHHCAYCGKILAYEKLTVDHLIPKSKSNNLKRNEIENLMPSCLNCNREKGSQTIEQYRQLKLAGNKNFNFYFEEIGYKVPEKIKPTPQNGDIVLSKKDIKKLKNLINTQVLMLIEEFISNHKK